MTVTHRGLLEAPTPTPSQCTAPYIGVIELHLGAVQSRASRQLTQFGYGFDLHQQHNIWVNIEPGAPGGAQCRLGSNKEFMRVLIYQNNSPTAYIIDTEVQLGGFSQKIAEGPYHAFFYILCYFLLHRSYYPQTHSNLCSAFHVTDRVTFPYTTTCEIIILQINLYILSKHKRLHIT